MRLCWMPSTSVAMASFDAGDEPPVLSARTARSRTRRAWSSMFCSAESVASRNVWPSEMLRACWVFAACPCRVIIDVLVPVGSSDGVLIVRPDVSWFCSLVTTARLLFRPRRLLVAMARAVIRMSAHHVHQVVEHAVDRADQLSGGRVGVLELEHVGHLLVDAHARDRVPG